MAKGRRAMNGNPGLSPSTTISIGTAFVILISIIGMAVGGSWWTSNLAAKVDQLTEVGKEVKSDLNSVKNDVNSMKFDLNNVKTSVNQLNNETVKRR